MIELRGVVAGYRRGRPVLRGATASLRPPCIILGPNGAGKTTLFRVILGLTRPFAGKVLVDGHDVAKIYGVAGLVSTNLYEVYTLLDLKLADVARLYTAICGGDYEAYEGLLEQAGFGGLLDKRLQHMSAGERRIALNLLAIAMKSRYMLLDEPFENLDPRSRVWLLRVLLRYTSRIVVNTHATWLLGRLRGWSAYIMVSGRLYGPVDASILPRLGITRGRAEDALLVVRLDGEEVSLVREGGKPISDIDSLDRLYEVVAQ